MKTISAFIAAVLLVGCAKPYFVDCDFHARRMRAMDLCRADAHCILSPKDFRDIEYHARWLRACEEAKNPEQPEKL